MVHKISTQSEDSQVLNLSMVNVFDASGVNIANQSNNTVLNVAQSNEHNSSAYNIDGPLDQVWASTDSQHSMHATNTKDEWWYVEFDKEYGIKYYEIFTRMYSSSQSNNRLNGAFVKLLNSDDEIVYQKVIEGYTMENAPFKDYPRSFNRQTLLQTFGAGGSAANRVKKIRLYRVQPEHIAISLIKFFDKNGINVTHNDNGYVSSVTSSSIYQSHSTQWHPEYALQGLWSNSNNDYFLSENNNNEWMMIELLEEHEIRYFEIYGRKENHWGPPQINDIIVELYDATDNIIYSRKIENINAADEPFADTLDNHQHKISNSGFSIDRQTAVDSSNSEYIFTAANNDGTINQIKAVIRPNRFYLDPTLPTVTRYNSYVTFTSPWDQKNGLISVKDNGDYTSYQQYFTLKPTTRYLAHAEMYSDDYVSNNPTPQFRVIRGHVVSTDLTGSIFSYDNTAQWVWSTVTREFTSTDDGKITVILGTSGSDSASFRNVYIEEIQNEFSTESENHVLCTYKNGEQHIYIDGEEAETTPIHKALDYTPGDNANLHIARPVGDNRPTDKKETQVATFNSTSCLHIPNKTIFKKPYFSIATWVNFTELVDNDYIFHWDGIAHEKNDYVVSIYISSISHSQTSDGADIEFHVNSSWTAPQTYFNSVAQSTIVTRTFSNIGAADKIRITAKGNDGFYYWKLTVNGVTIIENSEGINNSPGSSSLFIIDGDGSNPSLIHNLPSYITANNLSAIVRDEPQTHTSFPSTKKFVTIRTTITHYQMKLPQIGGITWYFHLTENTEKFIWMAD